MAAAAGRERARPFLPGISFPPEIGRPMKKLKLQMEDLAVESFPTSKVEGRMGTVQGQEMVPTPPYLSCQLWSKPTDCPCTPI
jgi:hypothetical protein